MCKDPDKVWTCKIMQICFQQRYVKDIALICCESFGTDFVHIDLGRSSLSLHYQHIANLVSLAKCYVERQ